MPSTDMKHLATIRIANPGTPGSRLIIEDDPNTRRANAAATSTSQGSGRSDYQQNLYSPPVKSWSIDMEPTNVGQMLASIYNAQEIGSGFDQNFLSNFNALRSQPGNQFYQAYWQPTNSAVSNLRNMGVNTSALTDDWFQQNRGWESDLIYSGTTNTPSKPGKKATAQQNLAYELYQYAKAEGQTKKAEQELKAINQEAAYWAGRKDLNLSDDEILGKIEKNMSKYPTLNKMRESTQPGGTLLELNRGVNFSDDTLRGVIWAARNGADINDTDRNVAEYYLKKGNQWTEDESISRKLDPGDKENYAPYSVGMTLDEEGLYFGRDSFDQEWVDENRSRYLGSKDDTAIKAFTNVAEGESYTQKLESELDAMKKDIDYLLQYYDNPEDIIAAIQDTSDYSDLFDLDKTMTLGNKNFGKLKGTTRAVDYRWKDIEAMIREKCAAKSTEALDDMLETSQATTEDAELPTFYAPPEAEWIDDSGSKAAVTPVGSAYNPVTPAPVTPAPQQTAVPMATPGMPVPTVTPAPVGTPAGVSTPGPVAVPTPAPANVQTSGQTDTLGEFGAGNINLHNRPVYVQEDGSISTVNSMSFYDEQEKKEILIPTIVNGQQVSDDEAVEHYYESGEYLGKFDTPEEANEYAEKLHEQQETLYAQKEATVVPVATPGPTSAPVTKIVMPVHNETQKAINAQAMANLNKMAPTIMGQGTDAEKVALQTGKNAWFDLDVKLLREGKMPGLAWLKNYVVRSTADGYMETSEKIYEYESHQKNRQDTADALSDITAQWEALNKRQEATDAIANASTEEYLNIARLANDPGEDSGWGVARAILEQGENYVPESPVMPDDPEWALAYLYNEVTGTSPYGMDTDSEANLARAKQWWEAISSGEYQGIDTLTNEEQQEMNDLRLRMDTLNERIEQEDEYLKSEEKAYREAQNKKDGLARRYTLAVMLDNATGGKSDTSLLNHLDYIFNAGTEELRPEYLTDNVIDLQVQAGNLPAELAGSYARDSVAVNLQAARELESSLAYLDRAGVKIPERTRRIVLSKIDTMRKDAKEAAYVMLDDQKDFESVAATGMEKARNGEYGRIARTLATGSYGFEFGDLLNAFGATNADRFARRREMMDEFANLMTPKEKSRYFYLLEKEGEKAANDYFNLLTDPDNGVLINRRSQELQEGWQEMASGSVAGAIFGTALSFLTNMQAGPSALIYEVGSKLQGKGINPKSPWFDWGNATSAFRAGTKEQLTKAFGEGSFGDSLSNLLYDGFTSSVDSLINSQMTDAAFGAVASFFSDTKVSRVMSGLRGLMEHTPAGRFAVKAGGDLAHAIPMGLSAATTAYKDVIERYGPEYEEQAVRMAMATLFAETASEAITVGNIHDAFAKGQNEAATSLKSILIDFLKQGGEEFLGEGANEWVEQNADRIIMGQLSEYEQIAQSYIDAGYPETLAYEMADREAWRGILRSAATGFVSAGFSTSVSYVAGRVSSRGLTEETATEPAVTEETVTEPAVTEEDVDEDLTPSPGQQRVEEATTEQRAQAAAAAEERLQNLAKDIAVLGSAGEADATGAAVGITAVLEAGELHIAGAKAAAQNLVTNLAGGDSALAAQVVSDILTASTAGESETKTAIINATLTNAAGHNYLVSLIEGAKAGMPITSQDVANLAAMTETDSTMNPESFDQAIQNAIKESRIANRTMEILQSGEAGKTVAAAQQTVDQAKENLGRAQETKEKADAEVETASSTLSVAVNEQLQDAGNPALNAPVEQASNQLDAALNNQDEQQKAVDGAQQNLDSAKQKQQEAGAEAMTEARTQATAEVEQAMQQEAEAAETQAQAQVQQGFEEALAAHPATAPFAQPITVPTVNGDIQITGVFGYAPGETTTIYSTPQGYITDEEIDDYPEAFSPTYDTATAHWTNGSTPVNPAAWMNHSLQAVVGSTGELIDIIGFAGQIDGDNPVVMDINGNVYDSMDLYMQPDPFTGEDGIKALMDAFDKAGGSNLPAVEQSELYRPTPGNEDVQMPDGFVPYPGGPMQLTAWDDPNSSAGNKPTYEIVGVLNDFGPGVQYVASDGTVVPGVYFNGESADFQQWWLDLATQQTPVVSNPATDTDVSQSTPDVQSDQPEGEVSPETGETLKDWQDPKYHGKVKKINKKQNPKSKAFKKWFGQNASEAIPYLTNSDGSPRIFYRGYGSFGKYQYVEHKSKQVATSTSGKPMYKNFYMSTMSTAQTYAGTSKITKFRDIANWETAKAGMQDLGMDLVEAPNPNNPGEMGYQVMYKTNSGNWVPAEGKVSTWFAEDQLPLFRQTYGGNLKTKGIHAGFVVASKPLIINGHGANWSNIYVGSNGVTAPDGATLTGHHATDDIASWAFNHGFDTVILDGIMDNSAGGGEVGTEVITSSSEQFKSIWNNGKYGMKNPNILAMKQGSTQSDVTTPESKKTGELERLMGKPVSDKFKGIVQRLFSGEHIDREQLRAELEDTDEIRFQKANQRQGSSLDDYQIDVYAGQYEDGTARFEKQLSPGRQALHKEIKATLDKQGSAVFDKNGEVSYTGKVKQGKRLDLIIGSAASGKSTISDHISAKYGSRFMDSDMVKELLPEYDNGLNADYVHAESKLINDQRMSEAVARGDNIIFSIIGNDPKSISARTQEARNAGYEVHLHMTNLDADKSLGRALSRYIDTARFIGLDFMLQDYTADIQAAFDLMKNEGGIISGYTKWNTDVPKGQQPILTESSSAEEGNIFLGRQTKRDAFQQGTVAPGGRGNESGSQNGMDNGGSGGRLTPTQKQAETVKAKYSPATIAKNLAKAIGVGDYIGTRKFDMDSATQAYYDRHSKSVVARNKNAGNYIVTMHELGHAIAHRFGLTATNELVTNFRNDPNPESGIDVSSYDPAALPGEAMAEFMWHYMQGEQSARQFAGDDFYDTFEETIRGTKEGKAIAEAREQMQLWLNADACEQIGTTIKNRSDKIQVPLKQRIREFIASMVDSTSAAAAFDEATGADNVLDSVRAQAAWANTAGKQATSILMGAGLTDANGVVIGPSLAAKISETGFKATGDNLDLLSRYMLAKHSLARDKQNKPVFDEHITKEARQAFIDDIELNHPEVAKAQRAIVDFWYNFLQEFMVNTGRLTQEAYDEMKHTYPDYAPTFRVKSTDGTAQRTGKGKIFQIQRASGSTENIYNPLDSLFGMINTIVGQNALNRVALTFDRMYQTHEGLGAFAREVIHEPGQKTVEMSNKQQQVKDLVGNMIDADTLDVLLGIVGNGGFTQNSVASHDTLKVVRPDGTIAEYQFEDMELFKLLAGINTKTSNAALDAIGFVTRAMSAFTTGSNPIFAARNFMRDFQNSVNYGSWASNYGTGVIKWLRSAYEVWRGESQDVKDYEALGGGGWTRIDPSRVASRNELYSGIFEGYETSNVGKTAKWAGKKVWNAITLARLNEVVEQASRFAEYKYGKHDLNTQEGKVEAFLAAQDATVDFNRAGNGKLVPAMKKLVPFFNASVQGVYRTGRMLTKAERGRAPARFTKTVVNTALLSALCSGILMKFMDDDDKKEFEMLSDDLKSKHFYLPNFAPDILGEAPLIRIPLAQDPLTYAIHGAVTNAMWSGQTEDGLMIDLAAVANTIIDNLNPVGSGTVLAPLLAVNANKSWFGSRIVPSHLERNKYAPDQYTEETPGIFRTFGRWLNMSPMKIQYLAEQYTGFLGQLAIPALSMNSRGELGGLPAAINAARKRFTSDPLTSNDVVGSFYDGADILNSVIEETNQGKPLNILRRGLTQEEAGQAYEEAKSLTSTSGAVGMAKARINELYNEIDEINERQGLSDREKYQLTSEKRREMIEVAVEANEKLGEYTEKYVTGSNMATRMISEGSASYKPTAEEKLPQTFRSDEDRTYMQRASEVYGATGKESALPHPSQKLTITDRLGNQNDYTIANEDWDRYTEIYKVAYESYMVRKGARWEALTDKQKQQLLTNAHSAGNKAMREQYARENGIQMKK